MFSFILSFVGIIFLTLIGFIMGRIIEQRHFERLRQNEDALRHIRVLNIKTLPDNLASGGQLISGNVVIAFDYFKYVSGALRILFGGELRSYRSFLERGRREAIIRMQKQAQAIGFQAVYNVRFEFSIIGQSPRGGSGIELLVYGTGVKYAD